MLTNAGITAGYIAVLGVPAGETQIAYWLVYAASTPKLTDINFPTMLATVVALSTDATVIAAVIPLGTTLAVVGNRARSYQVAEPQGEVLAVMANWTTPIVERLTYETDIMLSRNGTEQRACRRSVPRVIYEYDFMIYNEELNSFQNQIYAVQGRKVYIPIWSQMRQLGAGLNTVDYLRAGKYLLFSGYNIHELVTVNKTEGGIFSFATQPLTSYYEGSWIIPVEKGSVRDRVHFSLINERVATGSIQAIMDSFTPQTNEKPTYKELPEFTDLKHTLTGFAKVFSSEPNWTTALGLEFTRPTGLIDFGGKTTAYDLHGFSDLAHTASFTCSRSAYSIRDLFMDSWGRFKSFYMPSFQNDLDVVAVTSKSLGLELTVKDVGFALNVYPKLFIKHLQIDFHTKPAIIVQIESAFNGVVQADINHDGVIDNQDVTSYSGLDYIMVTAIDPVVDTFTASDIRKISYVKLVRFNIDALECTWITPDWYTTTASFVGIRQ